jgi:hypothetical protein
MVPLPVCVCVCVYVYPLLTYEGMNQSLLCINLGMHIMAHGSMSVS